MNSLKFEEKQQFRQKAMYLVYFILLALLALFIYADVQQLILHIPFGAKPASDLFLVFITVFLLAFLLLFYKIKLETIITGESVFFRWKPFKKAYTQISWSEIEKAEITNYGSVGYGFRLTPQGTVHNVAGDKGLRLVLKSGKKLILGTQKPNELAEYLQQIHKIKQESY
jgi:predicted membrane protein